MPDRGATGGSKLGTFSTLEVEASAQSKFAADQYW